MFVVAVGLKRWSYYNEVTDGAFRQDPTKPLCRSAWEVLHQITLYAQIIIFGHHIRLNRDGT